MKIVSVTCARMGSTRLPGKCMKKLGDKTLVQRTIEFAKKLSFPIYILTPDKKIKDHSLKNGVMVINEPWQMYDVNGNILHKLHYMNETMKADIIILLQVTCPFRNLEQYKKMISDFVNSNYIYAHTVKKIYEGYKGNGSFYIFRKEALKYNALSDIEDKKMYLNKNTIDIDTKRDFKEAEKFLNDGQS